MRALIGWPDMVEMKNPLLYVVIVNHSRAGDTLECLASVYASNYHPYRVVVVDNASQDRSVTLIRQAFPQVVQLESHVNLGFAEGSNLGMRLALEQGAELILLLNNDVILERSTLSSFVAGLSNNPSCGAAGCRVRVLEEPGRIWAAGESFSRFDPYPPDGAHFDLPRELEYGVGCCLLLTRKACQTVGLLASEFFAVHEERDWCARARRAGFNICYVPQAVVQHKVGSSLTSNRPPLYHYLYLRNELLFRERSGRASSQLETCTLALRLWFRELQLIAREPGFELKSVVAAARGIVDYYRGRFGPPPEAYLP